MQVQILSMGKKRRPAEPLSPRALSVWHGACIEEIHQGNENWGVACLLGTHTGMRRRIISHYTNKWRVEGSTGYKIKLPKGERPCTVEEDGCYSCHQDHLSGDNGYFMVKKNTNGQGRSIPMWEEWYDYHKEKSRSTELLKWLDHYFENNETFGFGPEQMQKIVPQIAQRKADIIIDEHEGTKKLTLTRKTPTVPDIKPHDLRATWAQQCLRAGVDDDQLMDWAGWTNRDMIDRYRRGLDDPSGENRKAYAQGRDGGLTPSEKISKLQELGVINEDENLSAGQLAELEGLLS